MTRALHASSVLWLIREGIATTWAELCAYFDYRFSGGRYSMRMGLQSDLVHLRDAGLIEVERGDAIFNNPAFVRNDLYDPPDVAFSVAPNGLEVLKVLGVSLTQLAGSKPWNRMLVEPEFHRTAGTQYKSDILVFMPFSETVQPVYEDHMKAVAAKLGQSIKRGDDFFTAKHVMADIWTALVETKVVIADCTGRNPNVFYEIGLAHAIGKPTILIAQNDDDVPFDLRQWRYTVYELTPRGMKRFEEQLAHTIRFELE